MTNKRLTALAAIDIMVILISLIWKPTTYNLKIVDIVILLVAIVFGVWIIVRTFKWKRTQK